MAQGTLAFPQFPTVDDLIQSLKDGGIKSHRLLAAFRRVERALFVPPDLTQFAYYNHPIAIGFHRFTQQPSLIAKWIETLRPKETDTILEVGTGTGYQTGLLAFLCKEVYSTDDSSNFIDQARANLRAAGIHNVSLFVTNKSFGLPQFSPYNGILSSKTFPIVPLALVKQLAPEGRLIIPLRSGSLETVALFKKVRGGLVNIGMQNAS